jgi:hypothetical protein
MLGEDQLHRQTHEDGITFEGYLDGLHRFLRIAGIEHDRSQRSLVRPKSKEEFYFLDSTRKWPMRFMCRDSYRGKS